MQEPVFVTRSLAPDPDAYIERIRRMCASRHLTNHGPFSRELEQGLAGYLRVPHISVCANGTLALQLGLHAIGLAGKEVVTTPFTYVATLSALLWEGCRVIFADIDEVTCCLDPKSVEERLTPDTAGLLPVHIYGNACDVDALASLAQARKLKILYDAAQVFGSELRGRSLFDYGDCAAGSFHATKIFHTVEGGCLATRDPETHAAFTLMRSCGHVGDNHLRLGINAKLSEPHAAMGLCLLDQVKDNITARAKISSMYDALLPDKGLRRPALREGLTSNYAYYPVIFEDESALLQAVKRLNRENIFPRRYFFPALNTLSYLPEYQPCPIAESVARRALCLPLYAELEEFVLEKIATRIRESL